jgi:signal transduction histidine kinase
MSNTTHSKVLVVNDDRASLLAMSALLKLWSEEYDYDVVLATSGQEALREVLKAEFAVIYLDVNMPGMDGYETARTIRRRPQSANTPIIFVTAYSADEGDRSKAYACGAADFLFTPVIPQILRAKTKVFVSLFAKSAQLTTQGLDLTLKGSQIAAANELLQVAIEEREAAEKLSDAKDEFLAMLGHELRNPLSAITSAISLLAMPNAAPGVNARASEIIRRQSLILTEMVEELMELSRAISGKLNLDMQRHNMADIVSSCLREFVESGCAEDYQLSSRIAPATVFADPLRVATMVNHLLENAIKYTPAGGEIEVSLEEISGSAIFSVRDSGAGISSDLLPNLFEVFVQGETTIDRSKGGLGIGLALVRRLSELHGGSVSARSDGIGSGSTFVLRLPTASTERSDNASIDAQFATTGASHLHGYALGEDNGASASAD